MPTSKMDSPRSEFAHDVLNGLSSNPKQLQSKYFYDEIGSQLFEEITAQPEYYPTRTEAEILAQQADAIDAAMEGEVSLVELGSGSSEKTTILLESFLENREALRYIPIDISPTILDETVDRLDSQFPNLDVTPIASQYEAGLAQAAVMVEEEPHLPDQKLVLFLGSSIGNMEPTAAKNFLAEVRGKLSDDDALLIGFDLQKDRAVMTSAYNDSAGVTSRFNKNILTRINRELDGQFDLDEFSHKAFYNEARGRIEMHLESKKQQDVKIGALDRAFHFEPEETIHTENSYKYTEAQIQNHARAANFEVRRLFTDENDWFGLALLRAA